MALATDLDYYCIEPWLPLTYTSPILNECDIELVKKSLTLIVEQTDLIPESEQLVCTLNNYIKECNNAFLASERIRNFLLLGLFTNLIITFIVLVSIPVTPLSFSLVCFTSLILFAVNIFTLYQQTQGLDQEDAKNGLTKCLKNFKKILNSKNLKSHLINKQQKFQSPTSMPCLFPAQKIPQNDELEQTINESSLNDPENFPPPKLNHQQ